MGIPALCIYAGPRALVHIQRQGLLPADIRAIPAAAGGPKGLILGPLDQFIFGNWLSRSEQVIDLIGASIGAWRMATACLDEPVQAFQRLSHDYIHQHYELEPGQKRPPPHRVSEAFGDSLRQFYGGRVSEVIGHPRYRLHILATRGRHLLGREHALRTPLGYLGASLTNLVSRRAMGTWLERVVFSATSPAVHEPDAHTRSLLPPLPFADDDYRTRHLALTADNFYPVLQASCSIPFVLQAVHDIPGAPRGAYWDGGISDYHLHLNYRAGRGASHAAGPGIVLYPHFQRSVVPGWLDKPLSWRHRATPFLDDAVVIAPHPEWVRQLPNAKLPDRKDFTFFGNDLAGRVAAWKRAVSMSEQLAEEFARWLDKPDPRRVQPLGAPT